MIFKQRHNKFVKSETSFVEDFTEVFNDLYSKSNRQILIVCIGTDRATGDSLAPIIGYKLHKDGFCGEHNIEVFGTLDNPVHAKNLHDTLHMIDEKYDNPFVIAIDACLGRADHIGLINVFSGSLFPGAGVGKDLPPVGDMSVTGIVNFSGPMDMLVLQNTRLSVVMGMADIIANGLVKSFSKIHRRIA